MIARSVGRSVGRSIGAGGFAVAGGGGYDTDAQAYITAVEAADTESLETGVKDAINAFVAGCKSDGIWDAIKASCILAGARTLTGALVPLKGTAPTNNNFVSGDYNRETGLVGDGSTKYLDSNRNNNADPQDDKHISIYVTTIPSGVNETLIGAIVAAQGSWIAMDSTTTYYRINTGNSASYASKLTGSQGVSRSSSTTVDVRIGGATYSVANTSYTPIDKAMWVFGRGTDGSYSTARLAFYSIGESLDLALLDSRVSTLMTAIGAAIP